MASVSFDSGGRRCIRPILEQYQSGMDKTLVEFSSENFPAKNNLLKLPYSLYGI